MVAPVLCDEAVVEPKEVENLGTGVVGNDSAVTQRNELFFADVLFKPLGDTHVAGAESPRLNAQGVFDGGKLRAENRFAIGQYRKRDERSPAAREVPRLVLVAKAPPKQIAMNGQYASTVERT